MLGFFRLTSFVSLGLVFTVIIIGAFLSARGQELSCSDWPLCPTGFSLSPGGKYFVEYVHRIIALIAAVSVYITAIYSIKRFVKARKAATAAAIAVSIQIVIGMLVVLSELQPIIVSYSYCSRCPFPSIGSTNFHLILPCLLRLSCFKQSFF